MKIHESIFTIISFSIFLIFLISLLLFNKCNKYTIIDTILIYVGIIVSLIILISKNNFLLDIAHFLYIMIYLVGVSLLSNNKNLLIFNNIMLFNIGISKLLYNECILNKKQQNHGLFFDINKKSQLNWNYIYIILFIISYYKIYYKNKLFFGLWYIWIVCWLIIVFIK